MVLLQVDGCHKVNLDDRFEAVDKHMQTYQISWTQLKLSKERKGIVHWQCYYISAWLIYNSWLEIYQKLAKCCRERSISVFKAQKHVIPATCKLIHASYSLPTSRDKWKNIRTAIFKFWVKQHSWKSCSHFLIFRRVLKHRIVLGNLALLA